MSQGTTQVPSVGRVVHYVAYGSVNGPHPVGVCRAAIITAVPPHVESGVVDICVLNPTGMYFNQSTPFSAEHKGGSWHWPEYVAPIVDEVSE